ncbi:unnamed protein product [Mycena citricolor]|uniref:Glutamine amidotransferase domain-containing protein n=1 Tax=Mycena citricolor TaxID=2018698 RepID=A0AAD2HEI6_9AGAR|nr:unnamed protein product [Mycena citricolor]
MSKSIALLICDTPMASVLSVHGDYHVFFTDLLHNAGMQAQIDDIQTKCRIDAYDVVHKMNYPTAEQLEQYDGIIITGSKASAYEEIPWINKLVDFVARTATMHARIKIFGICFGHQIVARALGGECVKNGGRWEVGPTPITLTPLGQSLFRVESATLHLQEMHQDHVPEVPETFHLLGSTDVSKNQGMVRFTTLEPPSSLDLSRVHILTVQGHPEFTEAVVTKLVYARAQSGVITPETAQDAIRRSGWPNDGVSVIGRTILGVLGLTR